MLELELLRLNVRAFKMPLLLVEEDLDGVREVTGVSTFSPDGLRAPEGVREPETFAGLPEPEAFPGLRVVTSMGILSHKMESLENVSFSAFDVRVDVDETV